MAEDDEVDEAPESQPEPSPLPAGEARAEGPPSDVYGVNRVLALSDGVFAIAMTLLVLDITVTPPQGVATSTDAVHALLEKVQSLGIYAFSFGVVAIQWLNHHRGLRRLREVPRGVLFRNLCLLLLVCLVPFASAYFERFTGTRVGNQVYLGTMFLLGLASALTVPWLDQLRQVGAAPGARRYRLGVYIDHLGSLPAFGAGFVLAYWVPGRAAFVALALIGVGMIAQSALLRGFRRPPTPDPDEYGVGRMLALSDGVFAIAMTLLVLNIAVPAVRAARDEAQAVEVLRSRFSQLLGFGISFVVVGLYWIAHHYALRRVTTLGGRLLQRNLVFLFAVCLVPFAMNFFDTYNSTVFGNQFFFAAFGVLGLLSSLVAPWGPLVRQALRGGWRPAWLAGTLIDASGTLPVSIVGILLCPFVGPGYAQVTWVLMFPLGTLQRKLAGPEGRAGARDRG